MRVTLIEKWMWYDVKMWYFSDTNTSDSKNTREY